MRLLRISDLQVVEVADDAPLDYAILSHTWSEGEVSLQDLETRRKHLNDPFDSGDEWERKVKIRSTIENLPGFAKMRSAAVVAHEFGYKHVWIDTCCIDKTSSAELSEAINSMFRWYQAAGMCCAYLSDVEPLSSQDPAAEGSSFRRSRWFTRGWTLQELIAPPCMIFFARDWSRIGDKADPAFCRLLTAVTGVDERVMSGRLSPLDVSVANRMRWAALRRTTRVEDVAYCLMGIFNVNMPLLYGEGERAFMRLQQEILKGVSGQAKTYKVMRRLNTVLRLE
jgi:hypothetical protein